MSDFSTCPRETKARKEHRCFLCTRSIRPGDTQVYWKCLTDGRFDEVRCHPECLAFLKSFCHDDKGCQAQCDGMQEECMWQAMIDRICYACPDRKTDYRDRCRVAYCEKAAAEVRRIGGDLLGKKRQDDVSNLTESN